MAFPLFKSSCYTTADDKRYVEVLAMCIFVFCSPEPGYSRPEELIKMFVHASLEQL